MDSRDRALPETLAGLAEEATAAVRRWLDAASGIRVPAAEARLAELAADPDAVSFAIGFLDGVLRPQDLRVAGRNLDRLSRSLPDALRWYSELGTQLAGGFAPLLPAPIVPLARDAFLRSVGQLLLRPDGVDPGKQLAALVEPGGIRPILAPVTAVASGRREGERQVLDARELLAARDAAGVSIPLSAIVGRPRLVDLDGVVAQAAERLTPLLETALAKERPVEFAVRELDELTPTLQLLHELDRRHPELRLGVGLPAALPDALPAAEALAGWAKTRRDAGRPPLTIRVAEGAHSLRMLDRLLRPSLSDAVRVVAASQNLFEVAWAWRLARQRRIERSLEHEFVLGLATARAAAVKRELGGIRLRVPVVQPGQLPLAVPYLVRRIQELADPEGSLRASAAMAGDDEQVFEREAARFRSALVAAADPADVPAVVRRYDPLRTGSADFTLDAARDWAAGVLARSRDSAAGEALLARSRLDDRSALLELIERRAASGREWGQRRGATRATVIESVAEVLAEWRGLLAEVAVSESGLTLPEADDEVTRAIALARRAARSAREGDRLSEAIRHPPALTVVVSSRTAPIDRPAGAVLAALAAGSAVILKTAPETRRSSAVLIETLVAGGVPEELLGLVDDEGELARELLEHPAVDRVLLDGSRHTAKLFHSRRPELPLLATTGGRNAIVVTPSADLENAVAEIVASAFDHAGQSPTAADVVILVGSAGENSRFLGRLRDAVASVAVGEPGTPGAGLAALARPASGPTAEALDVLAEGESWLVRPRALDESGRLWSPGLRDGVQPDSPFRNRENRAPVLGILRASSLAEAIELQNAPGFGLAAGLQSWDAAEIAEWLETVQAGMLFVNRPVGSLAGEHVPLAAWNRSRIGAGAAAGGPDEVLALGSWTRAPLEPPTAVSLEGVGEPVSRLIEAALPAMDFEGFGLVRAAALSDAAAWRVLGRPVDDGAGERADAGEAAPEKPPRERSVLRHRPVPVTLRASADAAPAELVRVLAAATLAGAPVAISSAVPLHAGLIELFGRADSPIDAVEVLIESEARWHARLQAEGLATQRIRLLGGDRTVLARVLHGRPGIAVYAEPVTASGRVELLAFLREQAIRMPVTRFDRPVPELLALPLG